MDKLFDFGLYSRLFALPYVQAALIAAAILGLLAGVLGPLIVSRNMAFAVHGTSELSFTGGAAALLLGVNVGHGALAGAIVAAMVLGLLSRRSSDHDSVIGAVLSFGLGVGVLLVLLVIYRPLLFASVDPDVARARGVPVGLLSIVFAVLVGVATALGVQTVGAVLVLALMITPAAAAARVTASPLRATVLAVIFAEVAALGGFILSLAPGAPVSAFVTAI